jgi:hypothetical protein
MTSVKPDSSLVAVARRVLTGHNFRVLETRVSELDEAPWLIAESEFFFLGVAAGETLDDLLVYEGYVAAGLGELLQTPELGVKRWDSYVVLLATSGVDERGRPDVVRLEYNTRSLRRMVSLGVAAHEDSVAAGLATFLPLPGPSTEGLPSAFDELVQQLEINGVPGDQAALAVARYRASGATDG